MEGSHLWGVLMVAGYGIDLAAPQPKARDSQKATASKGPLLWEIVEVAAYGRKTTTCCTAPPIPHLIVVLITCFP
ncbi:hypothetical protein G3N57_03365 [Paraburkholderia sp. Se-20369]|nr:hypothetical protein [Paraburkholderia sp. Se-20369]